MTLTSPVSFTDKSYIALLSFEEDRGFFLHISYGSHAIEPEKARDIQQLVMGCTLSGEERWQLSASGHSECLLRPDEAGKLYARLLRLLPGTLETEDGAPVQAYWDKHAAAVLAGSTDVATATLYEGDRARYEHEEASFMADVADDLPLESATEVMAASTPLIPYEETTFETDSHTDARWLLEGRLEERDGVGTVMALPMIEIGSIRYPAVELSRRMGSAGAMIRLEDGNHVETDLLRELGLGPMGRMADGTPIERNSRLTPQEIIQRGSERLRGPWEEMIIPELALPDGNGGLYDHFEFLCRWGISGAMLGGVMSQADALGEFIAERIGRFPSCQIALIGRKALLTELRKRWSSMLEPHWQEAQTGKATKSGTDSNRSLTVVPVSLLSQRSAVLPGGVDIAIYLEPDQMTADVSSKMYRAMNKMNARIRLSIFTENEFLDDPHLRTAQTSLLKLFHSVVREYAIADPEHPLTELPPPYTMMVRRAAQPGLPQMARTGGFTELELGTEERGLRIPPRTETMDVPKRVAYSPQWESSASQMQHGDHQYGNQQHDNQQYSNKEDMVIERPPVSSKPAIDHRSKSERMEGLLQELSRQGIHVERPPAFVQPEYQQHPSEVHAPTEYTPHTAYAGAELEMPHTEASTRRLYVPPAVSEPTELKDAWDKWNHPSAGAGLGWRQAANDVATAASSLHPSTEQREIIEIAPAGRTREEQFTDGQSTDVHAVEKNFTDDTTIVGDADIPNLSASLESSFADRDQNVHGTYSDGKTGTHSAHARPDEANGHERHEGQGPILLSRADGISYSIPAPEEPLPRQDELHLKASDLIPKPDVSSSIHRNEQQTPAEQELLSLEPLFDAYPPTTTGTTVFDQPASSGMGRSMSAIQSAEHVFALRAQEMAAQVEEEAEFVPFMSYWPTYESMTWRQKRWYFYWRGEVRQERYPATDLSYIFLLCYEVINGAGWQEPLDGHRLLMNLWRHYRHRFSKLDRYLPPWIVDFAQVHELDESMLELLLQSPRHVPSELTDLEWERLLTASPVNVPMELLPSLLDYDLERSRFYIDEGKEVMNEYIPKVLAAIDAFLDRQQGSRLLGLFRPPVYRENDRYLFRSAVYDSTRHGRTCTVRRLPLTEHVPLREFLTGIVKLTENELRKQLNVNGRLRIQPPVEPEIARLIERYIRRAFTVPEEQAAPRRVEIDPALLERLQADSAVVRDMLTLREEEKEAIRQEHEAEQAYAEWAAAAGQSGASEAVGQDAGQSGVSEAVGQDAGQSGASEAAIQAAVAGAANEAPIAAVRAEAMYPPDEPIDDQNEVIDDYEQRDELAVPGAIHMLDEAEQPLDISESLNINVNNPLAINKQHVSSEYGASVYTEHKPITVQSAQVGQRQDEDFVLEAEPIAYGTGNGNTMQSASSLAEQESSGFVHQTTSSKPDAATTSAARLLDVSELEEEWQECLQAMQTPHIELLAAMLDDADEHALQTVAARYGTMSALLADEINDLAMDHIGDLLLDDGAVMEEYRSLLDAIIMR
ncbi:TerB N-terminal domain-containing protein [Paenibacillus wenxiniae]|uniref:TerB N-terminal domain-containing protein n=1 Tax=Paenibacillus wenxiniae TaxID=1636843 RepID=A0ABW4RLF5_9BACL